MGLNHVYGKAYFLSIFLTYLNPLGYSFGGFLGDFRANLCDFWICFKGFLWLIFGEFFGNILWDILGELYADQPLLLFGIHIYW